MDACFFKSGSKLKSLESKRLYADWFILVTI